MLKGAEPANGIGMPEGTKQFFLGAVADWKASMLPWDQILDKSKKSDPRRHGTSPYVSPVYFLEILPWNSGHRIGYGMRFAGCTFDSFGRELNVDYLLKRFTRSSSGRHRS